MRKRALMLLMGCLMLTTVLTGCDASYSVKVGGKEVISSDKKEETEEAEEEAEKETEETEKEVEETEKEVEETERETEETEREETKASSDGVQLEGLLVYGYNALGYMAVPESKMEGVVFADDGDAKADERVYMAFTCTDDSIMTSYDEYIFGDSETANWTRQTFKMLNEQASEELAASNNTMEFNDAYVDGAPALIVSRPIEEGEVGDVAMAISMKDDTLIMLATASKSGGALELIDDFAKSAEYNGKAKDFSGLTDLSNDDEYVSIGKSFGNQLGDIDGQSGVDVPAEAETEAETEAVEVPEEPKTTNTNIDIGNGPWKDLVAEMVQQPWYRELACIDGKAVVGAMTLTEFEEMFGRGVKMEQININGNYGLYQHAEDDGTKISVVVDNETNLIKRMEMHGPDGDNLASVDLLKYSYGAPDSESSFYIAYEEVTDLGMYSATFYLDDSGENAEYFEINCFRFNN